MFPKTWRSFVLIGGETCLIGAAVTLSSYLRIGDATWVMLSRASGVFRIFLVVAVCQLSLFYTDLSDLRSIGGVRDLLVRVLLALAATSLVLAGIYFWFPGWIIGRGVFLFSAIWAMLFIVVWRLSFSWLAKRVGPIERLLLVGTNPAAVELARELYVHRHELGVEIVGFVDPDPARVGAPVLNPRVVGTVEDIPALVEQLAVDRVVVSLSDARGRLPMDKLLDIRLQSDVTFAHLASVYEEYTGKIAVENLRPSWLIFSEGFHNTRGLLAVKRVFDFVIAGLALIVAIPLMAVIAVVVKLGSRGPALYHQARVGLNGRIFTVHKFRTMQENAEAATGPVWSKVNDGRVTGVGRFMRRTRLDELPQLWNVVKGQMSLVGPRPERPEFVEQLTAQVPYYGQRHVLKPGLTGWAQIRYTYGASVEDAIEKLQYDLYYVKNLSIALDLAIVFETIETVLTRRGAR